MATRRATNSWSVFLIAVGFFMSINMKQSKARKLSPDECKPLVPEKVCPPDCPPLRPAELLSVSVLPVSENLNNFVIHLKNTSDGELIPRAIGAGDNIDFFWSNTVSDEKEDVLTLTFKYTSDANTEEPVIVIYDSVFDYGLQMHLQNNIKNRTHQDLIDIPVYNLEVNQEREVVYKKGQDITVNASISLPSHITSRISETFIGVDRKKNTPIYPPHSNNLIKKQSVGQKDPRVSVTLNTSQENISGYLSFRATVWKMSESPIVRKISVLRLLKVRPDDAERVFPEGFLAIIDRKQHTASKDGKDLRSCSAGTECWFECIVLGDHVTVGDVQTEEQTRSVSSHLRPIIPGMNSIHWKVKADYYSSNNEGISSFTCHADSKYSTTYRDVDIQVTILSSINAEKSCVEVEQDPTDQSKRKIKLFCVVRGRPRPSVYLKDARKPTRKLEQPDSVMRDMDEPYQFVAMKIFTIGVTELEGLKEDIRCGTVEGYYCKLGHYANEQYNFDLDLDQSCEF